MARKFCLAALIFALFAAFACGQGIAMAAVADSDCGTMQLVMVSDKIMTIFVLLFLMQ
jgi:hypothetical protein